MHFAGDVGFPYRCAIDLLAELGGDVVDHAAGGEVGDYGDGLDQHARVGAEGEGVFFADVGAVLIDEGEAVGVGVLGEADGGVFFADLGAEGGEVFFGGFGGVGEEAGGFGVHVDEFGAEFAEEHGGADAAGTVDGIEDDAEALVGDAAGVEEGEDGLDVVGVGAGREDTIVLKDVFSKKA